MAKRFLDEEEILEITTYQNVNMRSDLHFKFRNMKTGKFFKHEEILLSGFLGANPRDVGFEIPKNFILKPFLVINLPLVMYIAMGVHSGPMGGA